MGLLGGFLIRSRPEEALPVLEANLNLRRRYWSLSHDGMVAAQGNLAACLTALKRGDEALALRREICQTCGHAGYLARRNHPMWCESLRFVNWAGALRDEAKLLVRKLLPAARQSLGADHNCTLLLNRNLGVLLQHDPKRTRDDPRLNQHRSLRRRKPGATQATTCWKPRPSCRTWSRGDDGFLDPRIRTRANAR